MSKALDSGKAFLDQVLAKLPESVRDKAKEAFAAPEAADALTLVGDSVLARSDYSRQMDDLKAKEATLTDDYEKLNAWYATNSERLGKVETLEQEIARLQGAKPPAPTPEPKPPVAGMTQEDLEKVLRARDEGYAGVLAFTTTLATKHLRDFNEVLDVNDLVQHATKQRKSLADAYQEKFGDKLKAKADAEEQARIDKLVTERLAEERKKLTDQPFPLRNASPSVLDVLTQPDRKPTDYGVDAAVAEYERLQASRS